jgi:hypothetical protein
MRLEQSRFSSRARRAVGRLLLAVALAPPGAAPAQEAPASVGEAVGNFLDATKLRVAPPDAADFVKQSRPDKLDYAPLSPGKEQGPPTKKTGAELDAIGEDLSAALSRNKRAAARVAVPDSGAPAKKPKKAAKIP